MRMWVIAVTMLLACGCVKEVVTKPRPATPPSAPRAVQAKKAVMIIAHQNFRDEELLSPRRILEQAGLTVKVASSSLSPAKGMLGATVTPDVLVKDVDVAEYDAVIFVGGIGAQEYWDDKTAQDIAQKAAAENRVLGAICMAPVTLANAGVLKGKKATVWHSEGGRLMAKGANYTGSDVEVAGRVVTANGPEAAEGFGQAILAALGG